MVDRSLPSMPENAVEGGRGEGHSSGVSHTVPALIR